MLALTNFLNAGSDRADAKAVKVAALAKLQTTKTTKGENCRTLLQFVVRHANVPGTDLKQEIPTDLMRAAQTGPSRATIAAGRDQLRAERDDAMAERGIFSEKTQQALFLSSMVRSVRERPV